MLVYTSMYWYILVCTWMNIVFLKHWIFSVYHFGLLDVMYCAWEMCALILKHCETVLLYEQISVCTGIYQYVLIYTSTYMDEHSISQTLNIQCCIIIEWHRLLDVMYCAWDMCALVLKRRNSVLQFEKISLSDVTVHTGIYSHGYILVCTDIY